MNDPTPVQNPYVAPPAERYSPTLKRNERELLVGLIELRERPSFRRLLSRNLAGAGWTLPFAAAYGLFFALAASFGFGLSVESTVLIGAAAFGAALAGALFRDMADASNTQTLLEALNRITDHDEVERILYDRSAPVPKKDSVDEPLAAIPVDDE